MKKQGIIHYDEIALKGGNRRLFEQSLIDNIALKISEKELPFIVQNKWGRIVIDIKEKNEWKDEYDEYLKNILRTTPGVSVFGIGFSVESKKEEILKVVERVAQYIDEEFSDFRILTTRIDKSFPYTSNEMDIFAGDIVWDVFEGTKKVKLKKPDIIIKIEIMEDISYVYLKKRGLSGLPVGSSGRAISLLSGGFDSPVATHMCATRGVRPILMHFHSYPHTTRAAIDKVEELSKVLREVCGPITLVLVPLIEVQKEIALTAPERLRVVLYRRLMMKFASLWASKYNAKAIITGESVGQVASQTLENISVVEQASSLPILRPLCGMHKRDIIDRARDINTHDISILPHDDTCTVFMPKHPETRAKLEDVLESEKKYDSEEFMNKMLSKTEVIKL